MADYLEQEHILITTYWYYPDLTPRAFRTHELVKALLAMGHRVDLVLPISYKASVEAIEGAKGLTYHYVMGHHRGGRTGPIGDQVSVNGKMTSLWSVVKALKKVLRYLLGGDPRLFLFGRDLKKTLNIKLKGKDFDRVISIGLPFAVHYGTSRYLKGRKIKGTKVADYGDPYYRFPGRRKPIWYKYIERAVLKHFDDVTIPNEGSRHFYKGLVDPSAIKVIPQGYDLDVEIEPYIGHQVPTFCYAGIFYPNLRDPSFLFSYLSQVEVDFTFVLYTLVNSQFLQKVYEPYRDSLEGKVVFKPFIPRQDLLKVMSQMDFLVTIENMHAGQSPSKVIDYALSQRPILSLKADTFDPKEMDAFLKGDYSQGLQVDLSPYDIKKVTGQFLSL